MQSSDQVSFRYTLTFPVSETSNYPIKDVFNYIAEQMHQSEFDRKLHKIYLLKRLNKAIKNNEFEIWDGWLEKVRDDLSSFNGPSEIDNLNLWALNTYINGTDLAKFCKHERIRVVFTEGPATESDLLATWTIGNTTTMNEPISPGDITSSVSKTPSSMINSLDNPPCHEIARTYIRKLTIELAWKIECDQEGKIATAQQVIKKMQEMANSDAKDNNLIRAIGNGVIWHTSKYKEADYSVQACGKALCEWNKARTVGRKLRE
jgi:hypothetical protein